MGGGEGGNLGRGGEAPGSIFKIIPPYGLCWPNYIAPEGMLVCSAFNPQFWYHICTTRGAIEG